MPYRRAGDNNSISSPYSSSSRPEDGDDDDDDDGMILIKERGASQAMTFDPLLPSGGDNDHWMTTMSPTQPETAASPAAMEEHDGKGESDKKSNRGYRLGQNVAQWDQQQQQDAAAYSSSPPSDDDDGRPVENEFASLEAMLKSQEQEEEDADETSETCHAASQSSPDEKTTLENGTDDKGVPGDSSACVNGGKNVEDESTAQETLTSTSQLMLTGDTDTAEEVSETMAAAVQNDDNDSQPEMRRQHHGSRRVGDSSPSSSAAATVPMTRRNHHRQPRKNKTANTPRDAAVYSLDDNGMTTDASSLLETSRRFAKKRARAMTGLSSDRRNLTKKGGRPVAVSNPKSIVGSRPTHWRTLQPLSNAHRLRRADVVGQHQRAGGGGGNRIHNTTTSRLAAALDDRSSSSAGGPRSLLMRPRSRSSAAAAAATTTTAAAATHKQTRGVVEATTTSAAETNSTTNLPQTQGDGDGGDTTEKPAAAAAAAETSTSASTTPVVSFCPSFVTTNAALLVQSSPNDRRRRHRQDEEEEGFEVDDDDDDDGSGENNNNDGAAFSSHSWFGSPQSPHMIMSPPRGGRGRRSTATAAAGPLSKRLQSIRDAVRGDMVRFQSGQYPFPSAAATTSSSSSMMDRNDPRNRAKSYMDVTLLGTTNPSTRTTTRSGGDRSSHHLHNSHSQQLVTVLGYIHNFVLKNNQSNKGQQQRGRPPAAAATGTTTTTMTDSSGAPSGGGADGNGANDSSTLSASSSAAAPPRPAASLPPNKKPECLHQFAWISLTYTTAREFKVGRGSQLRIYSAVPVALTAPLVFCGGPSSSYNHHNHSNNKVHWVVLCTSLCEAYPRSVLPQLQPDTETILALLDDVECD